MSQKLLVVLPFHGGDLLQTKDLLRWISELGACSKNPALLVADCKLPEEEISEVQSLAAAAFARVDVVKTLFALPNERWPIGANWMFETAVRRIKEDQKMPFLWLEPDCTPLAPEWLERIEEEYFGCGKLFMGAIVASRQPGMPQEHLNGCAVYPANAYDYLIRPLTNKQVAWDISSAPLIVPLAHRSNLFYHFWGQKDLPPTFRAKPAPENPRNTLLVDSIPSGAMLFHRCKDGSLIAALREARNKGMDQLFVRLRGQQLFYHSGDFGDIVYALPTIQALGGGVIVLGPDNRGANSPRETMTQERAEMITALLLAQPYIKGVEFSRQVPPECVDLNRFRNAIVSHYRPWQTLAATVCETFKISPNVLHDAVWLSAPKTDQFRRVVVNRSFRYRNEHFPWAEIVERYAARCVFIGLDDEYRDFVQHYGYIERQPVENLFEAAFYIASAPLFLGNQSCLRAIAEGLKKPVIMEGFIGQPDCHFERKDVLNVYRNEPGIFEFLNRYVNQPSSSHPICH